MPKAMSFQKRKRRILEILAETGEVEVKGLAQTLGTSEITVRRDLNRLSEEGYLERTFGGAIHLDSKPPFTFKKKNIANAEAKAKIGKMAAAQVQEGEVIFMDCGSTVYQMCPFIKEKAIIIITNSLPVVNALLGTQTRIILIGGELDAQRQAVHGSIAEENIRRYQADRAFVGADGLSVRQGLSAGSEKEAGITLAMAEQANHTYLLCDNSKLEVNRYLLFAPIGKIDTLVTNTMPAQMTAYEELGIQVLYELSD